MIAPGVLFGLLAFGCSTDEADHLQPTTTTIAAPQPGFTMMLSFDPVVGGYWVPIEANDMPLAAIQGVFWSFGAPDDLTLIEGHDGCNSFTISNPEAMLDDGGRLIDINPSWSLQDCGDTLVGPQPEEGARFWIDESGDRLLVTSYAFNRQRIFVRQDDKPRRISLADEQAAADADAARRAEEDRRQQDEIALREAERESVRVELPLARQRWIAAELADYELRFSDACLECASFPRTSDGTHQVTVNEGVAESPWNDATAGATVDDWFAFVESNLDTAFAIEAEFDAERGFPTYIHFTSGEGTGPGTGVPFESWILRDVAVQPTDGV